MGVFGWTVVAVVIAGLGLLIPSLLIGVAVIVVITWVAGILNGRRLRRLADERTGESIC